MIFITFCTTLGILSSGIEASVPGNFVVSLASHLEKIALSWLCSLGGVSVSIATKPGENVRVGFLAFLVILPVETRVTHIKLIVSFPIKVVEKLSAN